MCNIVFHVAHFIVISRLLWVFRIPVGILLSSRTSNDLLPVKLLEQLNFSSHSEKVSFMVMKVEFFVELVKFLPSLCLAVADKRGRSAPAERTCS